MISKDKLLALRNISIITALFCLFFGLPNFGILAFYLPKKFDLRVSACIVAAGFGLSGLVLLVVILNWLRKTNKSLKDLGWAKPTKPIAVVFGLIFAVMWIGLGYMNNERLGVEFPIWQIDLLRICAAFLTVFAGGFVEEIAMRGMLMTELQKVQVRTWLQILVSGFCFALYHSIQFLTSPITFLQSLVICTIPGSVLAVIYVLGRRSLTPCILCHSLINLIGEPYLLMGAIAFQLRH